MHRYRFWTSLLAATLVAGCANTEIAHSGFHGTDYALMRELPARPGGVELRYVSPDFTPQKYRALLIEPLQYYPEPRPNEYVTVETLEQLRAYVDKALREKFGQRVQLVDKPGPGVARMRMALTAVRADTEAMAPYQFIPIGLVLTTLSAAATGGRPEEAKVAFESEVLDSVSGEKLYLVARIGTGARIRALRDGEGRKVALSDLTPLINRWVDTAAGNLNQYIRPR